jgi:hypothetical protein
MVAVEAVVRVGGPGRYSVDDISVQPLPSGQTSRWWGVGIKQSDGSVTLEPDLWLER